MKNTKKENRFFQHAHLIILIGYTIFSAITIVAAFTQSWELWVLVPIVLGVAVSWGLHIQGKIPPKGRIWICTAVTMLEFFFYGIHKSSYVDLAVIMAVIIAVSAVTAMRGVIYVAMTTYFVTAGYSITMYIIENGAINSETVARVILHSVMIIVIGGTSCAIIRKWDRIVKETSSEIEDLYGVTRRLDDFLANASHEIRTPVNAVIGLTEVCLDRETNEKNRQDLLAVQDAGRRVADQMSDILNFTELDRDVMALTPENYMISSLLSDVVAELRPFITPRLELVLDVDPSIPAVMNSDVYKLKRIIRHLIINGLKYTDEGGVYVRITSQETKYGVNLCIDVNDTGMGLNDKEKRDIFYGFYQTNSGRNREHGGLGLGLFIVKGFVLALNGFLTMESEPGKGTNVHVCLPQKVVDASSCMSVKNREKVSLGAFFYFGKYPVPEVREFYNSMITNVVKGMGVALHGVDSMENLKKVIDTTYISHIFIGMKEYETDIEYMEEVAKKIPVYITADRGYKLPPNSHVRFFEKPLYCFPIISAINSSGDQMAAGRRMYCWGVKVLVVDDEPLNLVVAKGILSRYGIETQTADSGHTAIDMCRRERYDIVFMDHMMPVMDGVEAMKKIREDLSGRNGDTPIVALTANTISTAREMFMKEGFDAFIGKPIEAFVLERVLRDLLSPTMIAYELPKEDKNIEWKKYEKTDVNSGKSVDSILADIRKNDPEETENTNSIKQANSFTRLLRYGIDIDQGLEYCQGDEELYKAILGDYMEDASKSTEILENALKDEDLAAYEIKIHALKGTSRMIGANELSDLALELEGDAKEGRIDEIKRKHDSVMEKFAFVTGAIRSVLK
ncbi:MAG: response regulator [Eubacterium sp.]|nr:response regulator [Eubacterium sp.]